MELLAQQCDLVTDLAQYIMLNQEICHADHKVN